MSWNCFNLFMKFHALIMLYLPTVTLFRISTRSTPSITRYQSSTLVMKDQRFNDCILSDALLLQGPVASGYGRGSKKLGFPTANLPYFDKQLSQSSLENGVYFGWAKVGLQPDIYPVVSNIGYSPTFSGNENKIRIVESYIINNLSELATKQLSESFYNEYLRVCLIGFLRPEKKFSSLDELIAQIQSDVNITKLLSQTALLSSLSSSSSSSSLSSSTYIDSSDMTLFNAYNDLYNHITLLQPILSHGLTIAKSYFKVPYEYNQLLSQTSGIPDFIDPICQKDKETNKVVFFSRHINNAI